MLVDVTVPSGDEQEVLRSLTSALQELRTDRLLAAYVHGSLVTGDFAPGRSDLDVLVVLADEPDEPLLAALAPALARVERRHPAWAGRVELELVSTAAIEAGSRDQLGVEPHRIARVSPGEALHLLPATRHRVLGWEAVRQTGRALLGPPPDRLLPRVDADLVRAALLDHVRDWPMWVRDMRDAGGQAYAVLTTCRAVVRLRDGRQLSKRQAADVVLLSARAEEADLVAWARDWWYVGGAPDAPARTDEVVAFVRRVCAAVLADDGGRSRDGLGRNSPAPRD